MTADEIERELLKGLTADQIVKAFGLTPEEAAAAIERIANKPGCFAYREVGGRYVRCIHCKALWTVKRDDEIAPGRVGVRLDEMIEPGNGASHLDTFQNTP